MLKFIDLRNTTGRASSVAIVDGTGSGTAAVRIIGALAHGDEFTLEEFDRFACEYLEVRAAMKAEPPIYRVGHNDRGGPFAAFRTAEDAAEFIGSTLRDRDPEGVDAGDYYIDGPEIVLEPIDSDAQGGSGDEPAPQHVDPYLAGIMARADSFPVLEVKPRLKYPDCPSCVNYAASDGYGPSHEGSVRCESKSIASGGSRAHCSCDTCW